MTTAELHWVAGLLEGEGCFHWDKSPKYPRIRLMMTDQDVVERFAQLTGGCCFGQILNNCRRPATTSVISGKKAIGWMMTLYSLVGERRKARIREIIQLWKDTPKKIGRPPKNGR